MAPSIVHRDNYFCVLTLYDKSPQTSGIDAMEICDLGIPKLELGLGLGLVIRYRVRVKVKSRVRVNPNHGPDS